MADRVTTWLALALAWAVGMGQVASCGFCPDLNPVESGEYEIVGGLYDKLSPEYEDLVGAQLIIDRGAETSAIRYTRDGTTYEVRHSLADP